MEDDTHNFFHCMIYTTCIDEIQGFNDTVRLLKPLIITLIISEANTGLSKQKGSCSGLYTDIFMSKNAYDNLLDVFIETHFKTNS